MENNYGQMGISLRSACVTYFHTHVWLSPVSLDGSAAGSHDNIMFMQDDEINLQCQLVEKLKQQMLDQDEVHTYTKTHMHMHTQTSFEGGIYKC